MSILTTLNYCTLESHVNVWIYLSQTNLCHSSTYICHPNCVTPMASYTGKMYKYICTEWNITIIIVTVKIWCTCIFLLLVLFDLQRGVVSSGSGIQQIPRNESNTSPWDCTSSLKVFILLELYLLNCKQQEMKMMCMWPRDQAT